LPGLWPVDCVTTVVTSGFFQGSEECWDFLSAWGHHLEFDPVVSTWAGGLGYEILLEAEPGILGGRAVWAVEYPGYLCKIWRFHLG